MPRFLPILALLLAAVVLRFHDLPGRVMHTDEAVHAVTVGRLLDGEAFAYDPRDFHGPTLHYSAIPVALARQQTSFSQLDEWTLRGVTAGYGVLLVLLTFAFRRELGEAGTWIAAWLAAISPMLVFFSRYFIMEIPFAVFLTLFALCLWRWDSARRTTPPAAARHDPRWLWLMGAGICFGLLHATKETFVIHLAAMALAAAISGGMPSLRATPAFLREHARDLAAMILLGLVVSAALLSHGFQQLGAIPDGFKTYLLYFQRADGHDAGHAQPWYFYFATLFFLKPSQGFFHSEIAMLVLGLAGAWRAIRHPVPDPVAARWQRLLAAYAILTAIAYSAIPYKTPWTFLATMHALVLLSGLAIAACIPPRACVRAPGRGRHLAVGLAGCLLLALTSTHALLYNKRIIADAPADPDQPMVYGHTSQDFLQLTAEIQRLEAAENRTLDLIMAESGNGWPMPWYRRAALGHNRYGNTIPPWSSPPDILAVSTEHFAEAAQALGSSHRCRNMALRPGVPLHVFFRGSLAGFQRPGVPVIGPAAR